MLLYLDTADIGAIKRYAFLLDGVTTTPTIIKRAGLTSDTFITKIRKELPELEVHIEALGENAAATCKLILNGFCTKSWYDPEKIVFKVPISRDGLETTRILQKERPEVKINLHMVFSIAQAILAMQVQPAYIAPLLGRYADEVATLKNNGRRSSNDDAGQELLINILACRRNTESKTHILASSIRNVHDFASSITSGADAITLPPAVLGEALEHPMTKSGVDVFWKDLV